MLVEAPSFGAPPSNHAPTGDENRIPIVKTVEIDTIGKDDARSLKQWILSEGIRPTDLVLCNIPYPSQPSTPDHADQVAPRITNPCIGHPSPLPGKASDSLTGTTKAAPSTPLHSILRNRGAMSSAAADGASPMRFRPNPRQYGSSPSTLMRINRIMPSSLIVLGETDGTASSMVTESTSNITIGSAPSTLARLRTISWGQAHHAHFRKKDPANVIGPVVSSSVTSEHASETSSASALSGEAIMDGDMDPSLRELSPNASMLSLYSAIDEDDDDEDEGDDDEPFDWFINENEDDYDSDDFSSEEDEFIEDEDELDDGFWEEPFDSGLTPLSRVMANSSQSRPWVPYIDTERKDRTSTPSPPIRVRLPISASRANPPSSASRPPVIAAPLTPSYSVGSFMAPFASPSSARGLSTRSSSPLTPSPILPHGPTNFSANETRGILGKRPSSTHPGLQYSNENSNALEINRWTSVGKRQKVRTTVSRHD